MNDSFSDLSRHRQPDNQSSTVGEVEKSTKPIVSVKYIKPSQSEDSINRLTSNDSDYCNCTIGYRQEGTTSCVDEIGDNPTARRESKPTYRDMLSQKIDRYNSFSIKVDISVVDDESGNDTLSNKIKEFAKNVWAFVILIAAIFSLIFFLIIIFVDISNMSKTMEILYGIGFYSLLFLFACGINHLARHSRGGGGGLFGN